MLESTLGVELIHTSAINNDRYHYYLISILTYFKVIIIILLLVHTLIANPSNDYIHLHVVERISIFIISSIKKSIIISKLTLTL